MPAVRTLQTALSLSRYHSPPIAVSFYVDFVS